MNLRPLLPFILAALAGCDGYNGTPVAPPMAEVDPLDKYRQLVGAWMDSTNSELTRSYESWAPLNDSVLTGHGYAMDHADTVFIEDLRIERHGQQVVYLARIDSQNQGQWVPFVAQGDLGTDSLVFHNMAHDFPQHLAYLRDGRGGWNVAVSGKENDDERVERFHFRRR